MELFLTLIAGLFIVLGTILILFTNNNKRIVDLSISMAFGVMITLGVLELLPESYKTISRFIKVPFNVVVIIIGIIIGIEILKILDRFVPNHGHDHKKDKDHKRNLYHVGIITSVALILHNFIEGITLYGMLCASLKMGILMCIGIGLHNIPIGMIITSTFYKKNKSKLKTILISIGISLSTFIGALVALLSSSLANNEFLEGVLLAVTLGMIIYITLFELINQLKEIEDKRIRYGGVLLGIILLVISILL